MTKQCITEGQIFDHVADFIEREASRKYPLETGGILIGKIDGNTVYITHASGPGHNAEHGFRSFKRDGGQCQIQLDKVVNETDGKSDYIGEWHSHPLPSEPSCIDVESMRWIAANPDYKVDNPLMLLLKWEQLKQNKWALALYIFSTDQLSPINLKVINI